MLYQYGVSCMVLLGYVGILATMMNVIVVPRMEAVYSAEGRVVPSILYTHVIPRTKFLFPIIHDDNRLAVSVNCSVPCELVVTADAARVHYVKTAVSHEAVVQNITADPHVIVIAADRSKVEPWTVSYSYSIAWSNVTVASSAHVCAICIAVTGILVCYTWLVIDRHWFGGKERYLRRRERRHRLRAWRRNREIVGDAASDVSDVSDVASEEEGQSE